MPKLAVVMLGYLYPVEAVDVPAGAARCRAQAKHRQRSGAVPATPRKAIMDARRGARLARDAQVDEDTGQSVDFIVEMRKKNAARFKARQRIAFLNLPGTRLKIKLLCAGWPAKKICGRRGRTSGWMKATTSTRPARANDGGGDRRA